YLRRQDPRHQEGVERLQQLGTGRHPFARRRAIEEKALALEDALLAVQWQMIVILADDDLCQQARAGEALVDRLRRLGCGGQLALAVLAEVSHADVLDDEERGRLVVELFAGLFADGRPRFTAAGAAALGLAQLVDAAFTGELARRLAPAVWPGSACGRF